MKLEQQVVSLELAQKIKELGVKQKESLFQWVDCKLNEDENGKTRNHWAIFTTDDYGKDPQSPMTELPEWYDFEDFDYGKCIPAFTVAELGELLPKNVSFPIPQREAKGWIWRNEDGNHFIDTEANARASLLIHLLENNFITL